MKTTIERRRFLGLLIAAGMAPSLSHAKDRPKKIMLVSSWNTDNIGDIAHTPGMLALLEKHLPDVEVTLAPWNVGDGVDKILLARFPKLRITRSKAEKEAALEECDFFLHGSGPGILGAGDVKRALDLGKPYGIGGISLSDGEIKGKQEILSGAKFVFTRDSESLKALKASPCRGPHMEFGPDATFALDLRNEAAADKMMAEHGLESGKFLCAVPRLRWTPRWEHSNKDPDPKKVAENEEFAERDHAKVREAITAWVRETKMRVLLAPEMTYAVPLLRPLLFDGLPDDVKPCVASLDRYWLTDEAASVYARAAAMVSVEQHSPIIAIANGTPAILLCQSVPAIRRKGEMWRDLGMDRWFFEIDECTGEQIAGRLLEIAHGLTAARDTAAKARAYAHERMAAMMKEIK